MTHTSTLSYLFNLNMVNKDIGHFHYHRLLHLWNTITIDDESVGRETAGRDRTTKPVKKEKYYFKRQWQKQCLCLRGIKTG